MLRLKKHFIESNLDAEFDEYTGYQKHDQNSKDVFNNYRKGKTKKTISTDNGKINIKVPREQLSTFEPKIVKKHERNISRIEDQILFLYSKGMSTRDIQEIIYQMFYCGLDKDTISRITNKIIPEIVMWQQRPSESIYPIIYIDGIRFKIREDSVYKEKSVYLIIGLILREKRDFRLLDSWIKIF